MNSRDFNNIPAIVEIMKTKKMKKKLFPKNVSGKSHSAENPKEGTLWGFLKSILLRTIKKLKGDSLETSKKTSQRRHYI